MLSVNSIARVIVNAVRSLGSISSFNTGLLLVKDANFVAVRRLQICNSFAEARNKLMVWGFADTSDPYKAAAKYFNASPAPSQLLLSCYPASETLEAALEAVLEISSSFYGIILGQTETDARVLALDEYLSSLDVPLVLFAPVIGSASSAVTSGSLLQTLHGRASKRTVPFFCAAVSDAAALAGTAMGLELANSSKAFSLCYKTINGIQPSELTESEATSIKAIGGNVYLTRGYTHTVLELGTVASGARYDEIMYIDKIALDLQNAAVAMLAENQNKMPQTDESTSGFITVFSNILMKYTDMNVLATGIWRGAQIGPLNYGDTIENGFVLWADSFDNQSDEDREAHKAMPISIGLNLAGSIESIVITVNVVI